MKSKLWVKILVPILIIAVIGGIWIVKNATEKTADDSGASQNNTELSDDLKDADFGLRETKAIDFEALSAYGLLLLITALIPVFLVNRWLPYWKKQIKSFTARHL